MEKQKFKQAYEKIQAAKNILLVTHERPDGDALASVCALLEYLTNLGKPCSAFCFTPPAPQFNYLPQIEKIKSDKSNLNFNHYDLIIINDCGGLNRTKLDDEISNRDKSQFVIEFDHHPKIDSYADLEIKDAKISSTCEMLYSFFKFNKIKINKNIANCLLAGILADTANFLFPITTDKTIEIASDLMLHGAKYPLILNNISHNKNLTAMKIWGESLNNLQINKKYNLAFSILKREKSHENKIIDEALEGLPEFLSNLYGVNALLLLRETEAGTIKGSLRSSRPKADISFLAQIMGGGGHAKASGFTIDGQIIQTKAGWEIE